LRHGRERNYPRSIISDLKKVKLITAFGGGYLNET